MLALLQRFYETQGGAIKIDGQDIASITQDSLRHAIALVPQDISLFHRTVYENIAYGRPEASREEVLAAAREARCTDFIEAMPEGFDTIVGDRGVKLSGGQRQRIAIARAILKNAPILLLDEATSALDSASEEAIQKALDRLMVGRTVVAIAHRLSTLQQLRPDHRDERRQGHRRRHAAKSCATVRACIANCCRSSTDKLPAIAACRRSSPRDLHAGLFPTDPAPCFESRKSRMKLSRHTDDVVLPQRSEHLPIARLALARAASRARAGERVGHAVDVERIDDQRPVSSRAAPANCDSTSTPGSSGSCAATYSFATRFMPSRNGVTKPTCASRNSAASTERSYCRWM